MLKLPRSKLSSQIFALFFLLPVLLLSACGKENLYQNLSEQETNEMLVVLYKNGIDAEKVRVQQAQDVSYTISVPKDKIQKARKVLVDNNLPRKRALGFSEICKEKGLIPTPEEEKCRKLLALKGEIINSLEKVPGVIEADVVLNIPEVSEFSTDTQATKKPTASAVIKVKKDPAGYEVTEVRMQRFISNAVENLDPRDVSVIINYVEPPQDVISQGPAVATTATTATPGLSAKLATIAGLIMDTDSVKRFKIYAVVMLVMLLGISAGLILNVIRLTKMRQELKVSKAQGGFAEVGGGGSPPLLEDGSKSSEPHLSTGEKAANQPH